MHEQILIISQSYCKHLKISMQYYKIFLISIHTSINNKIILFIVVIYCPAGKDICSIWPAFVNKLVKSYINALKSCRTASIFKRLRNPSFQNILLYTYIQSSLSLFSEFLQIKFLLQCYLGLGNFLLQVPIWTAKVLDSCTQLKHLKGSKLRFDSILQ